jgi:hypothetical protein
MDTQFTQDPKDDARNNPETRLAAFQLALKLGEMLNDAAHGLTRKLNHSSSPFKAGTHGKTLILMLAEFLTQSAIAYDSIYYDNLIDLHQFTKFHIGYFMGVDFDGSGKPVINDKDFHYYLLRDTPEFPETKVSPDTNDESYDEMGAVAYLITKLSDVQRSQLRKFINLMNEETSE